MYRFIYSFTSDEDPEYLRRMFEQSPDIPSGSDTKFEVVPIEPAKEVKNVRD